MKDERTFITRIAIATSQGTATDDVWKSVVTGRTSFAEIDDGEGRTALFGDLDTDALAAGLTSRIKVQTDPITQAALAMSDQLFDGDGAELLEHSDDIGVQLGNNYGGLSFAQRELSNLNESGPGAVSPYQSFAWFYSVNTGQIAIRHKLKGPSGTVATEACSGIDAIAQAQHELRMGAHAMVTGALDGTRSPFGIASMYSGKDALAPGAVEAQFAPYRSDSAGYIPGSGGALLVLQPERTAPSAQRDIELLGCVRGFQPRGRPDIFHELIERLFATTGTTTSDVGVIFSDGLGVPEADANERETLLRVFGDNQPPTTAPKTGFGRLFAGASAVDVALAALSLRYQWIPPFAARYGRRSSDERLNLVLTEGQPTQKDSALVLSTGSGGYRSAAILRLND